MAGHSKWSNIKHRKAEQDAKKGQVFTKLIRELSVAAKVGGAEVSSNPRLRRAVDKALAQNMNRDTVQRAIQRGVGGEAGNQLESITYEGFGPSGTAILIECLTDNRNRTVAEVRHAFSRYGGHLGSTGSVAYLFRQMGVLTLTGPFDEEKLLLLAAEAGAKDLICSQQGEAKIFTQPEQLLQAELVLIQSDSPPCLAELTFIAITQISLDKEKATVLSQLIDLLEDLDDVQRVYHNGYCENSTP